MALRCVWGLSRSQISSQEIPSRSPPRSHVSPAPPPPRVLNILVSTFPALLKNTYLRWQLCAHLRTLYATFTSRLGAALPGSLQEPEISSWGLSRSQRSLPRAPQGPEGPSPAPRYLPGALPGATSLLAPPPGAKYPCFYASSSAKKLVIYFGNRIRVA